MGNEGGRRDRDMAVVCTVVVGVKGVLRFNMNLPLRGYKQQQPIPREVTGWCVREVGILGLQDRMSQRDLRMVLPIILVNIKKRKEEG